MQGSSIKEDERINGENGWYIPRADEEHYDWMDLDEAKEYLDMLENSEFRGFKLNPIKFYLYTNDNPDIYQKITYTIPSINASKFDSRNPTRITIHGWRSSKEEHVNTGVRHASFSKGKYNMIAVDWGRARSIDYASSVLAVPTVGKKIAKLVRFLFINYGLKLKDVEIIGHSLGAHVAGYAGKNLKDIGQVHRIVGLDPALPLFKYNNPNSRLDKNDAFYVETIQTNGNKLGFLKPIGKSAFYPNGGQYQPGCGNDVFGSCSHSRSVVYFVEALWVNNFIVRKCDSFNEAIVRNCSRTYSRERMGEIANAYKSSGTYYVPVKDASPHGFENIAERIQQKLPKPFK